MSRKILNYYGESFFEDQRLCQDQGRIEWLRTLDILNRFLPPPPATVLDVGGATGAYSTFLLKSGYSVHLIDLVPSHVARAEKALLEISGTSDWSVSVGDARKLDFPDAVADGILLLGPLYHLQDKADRLMALRECLRILKPGGILMAAAISKFASFLDGLDNGFIRDPDFRKIIQGDLESGRHDNPTSNPEYFTQAYFQHPDELESEINEAGFRDSRIMAVEGILWAANENLGPPGQGEAWRAALEFMKDLEEEKSIIGLSPHLMGVGRKRTDRITRRRQT